MIKRSLLTKLMAALTLAMVLLAAVVAFFNYQMASSSLKTKFDTDTQAMVELTNSSLMEAVFAYDHQQIEAIAKSLANTSLISEISIVDHRGQSLAKAADQQTSAKPVARTGIPIEYGDNKQKIGSYDIVFSSNEMEEALASHRNNNILVVFAMLIVSLVTVFILTRRMILAPMDEVTRSLASIADGGGDLTRRLPTKSGDEIAALAHNFNRVMEHIADIIRNVVQVNDKVRVNVRTMANATESTVNSTSQQLHEIELVATAVEELSASANEIARHAGDTAERTNATSVLAEQGNQVVNQSLDNVNTLT